MKSLEYYINNINNRITKINYSIIRNEDMIIMDNELKNKISNWYYKYYKNTNLKIDKYLNINCYNCENSICCLNCHSCNKCIFCENCSNINENYLFSYPKIIDKYNIKLITLRDVDKFTGDDKINYEYNGIRFMCEYNQKILNSIVK